MLPQPIAATDNSSLGGSRGINPNKELGHEWTPDFPVMAEWIDYPAQTPAVGFLPAHDRPGSCRECPREDRIRIRDGQDHPNGTATQRLWTEVGVFGRLVARPKLSTVNS